jgi:predicted dehydrogenase
MLSTAGADIDDPEMKMATAGSPNNTHHDIAIAAFEAGKIVACESRWL